MVGDLEYPHRLACLPRQGKSHPDMGRSLQSCIFIVLESGEGIVRQPEHPLIQDSLTWKILATPHRSASETVGGNRLPRTPMGTEPLSWFGGGRRSREERIEAMHTRGFTQLRAARMRKTLLLLCGFVLCSCSGACGATVHASR